MPFLINFARTGPRLLILTLIRQIQEAKVVLEELVTLLRSIPVGRDTLLHISIDPDVRMASPASTPISSTPSPLVEHLK
jgi:hypothetical protein